MRKFKPYTGTDVSNEYTLVKLPHWAQPVWAVVRMVQTETERLYLGQDVVVTVLGYGEQPFIQWENVSKEARADLLAKLHTKERDKRYGD